MNDREKDTERFYELLEELEERVGGKWTLQECCRHMNWPHRGVYFFFEDEEYRNGSDRKLRVVRVGTTTGKNTVLWDRLGSHRSNRGVSVFRDHVGKALRRRDGRTDSISHRQRVSAHIRNMPFLWVKVFEENGQMIRDLIERNSVALLSGYNHNSVDQPSENWLGSYLGREDQKVRKSGLWNVHYVAWNTYKREFLRVLEKRIARTKPLDPCPECPNPQVAASERSFSP